MYYDDYFRQWLGPFPFTFAGLKNHVPRNRTGIYQLMDDKQILYIGKSGPCIRGRLMAHLQGRGNSPEVAAANRVGWRFVFYECDVASAVQIESHVLVHKKPPLNIKTEYKHYISNITVH